MLWILTSVLLAIAGYWWIIHPCSYWKRKGIKQKWSKPIFGDNWDLVIRKKSFPEIVQDTYNAFPNSRYSGIYSFSTPALVLRDPELIKQITVKDFDHFVDHNSIISEDFDPLWAKNLFALTGQRWRDMRSTISPTFTSSKMKTMFVLISQTAEQFANYFLKQEESLIAIDMKDTLTRFTNDVIANAVFGIECDSLKDPQNEFYLMGKDMTDLSSFGKGMKLILLLIVPKIAQFFGAKVFSKEATDFFTTLVRENIDSREKNNVVRPDVINLLMDAKKNGLKQEDPPSPTKNEGFAAAEESDIDKTPRTQKIVLTDEDITAQALIFFFAGFETVSSFMLFVAYELAINPDIQKKLIQEVDQVQRTVGNKLTYEAVSKMKYMDMVISETLRKWPVTSGVDRVCTKAYTIEPMNPDEVPVCLKEKDVVVLPIYGLHRDPQYYPDPERFDPERFSDDNKVNIKPYSYLPFGSGPRNCIGSRFALLESKALFFHILSNFEIVPVEKTATTIKFNKSTITLLPENGLWLGLKRRSRI